MGKKKFIDKKKSATFQLMARDTSDPNYSSGPDGDRVFVRVDDNQYAPDSLLDEAADPDSIFADASEDGDDDDEYVNGGAGGVSGHKAQSTELPDHIRREILELGFPDDGYNYLVHMREIKNTGGGSAYYQNPKAEVDQFPMDVKAYDASRVEVSKIDDASYEEKFLYSVASKTVGVRLQKAVDPEVAAMLDDSDASKYDSDIDDLEEDFVVKANLSEGGPTAEENGGKLASAADLRVDHVRSSDSSVFGAPEKEARVSGLYIEKLENDKPRVRRPLDEHFDMVELQEYGADSEEEYNPYIDEDECQESLKEKLNHAFKDHPSGLLHLTGVKDDNESPEELAAEVIERIKEYAVKYEDDGHDLEEVLVEKSSDESEVWDCETIVTTYSTLDNHPGKIGAPEARRRKKLADAISDASAGRNHVITLKGKEGLPVDFLPRGKKHEEEKIKDEEKDVTDKITELQKRKPRGQESKEEKKERKSAVKSERREARQVKKEIKGLYKSESHRAQKVAAFTGPSSIHLM